MPLLEAQSNLPRGLAKYAFSRWCEVELMLKMQMTEAEYVLMPVPERARKIAVMIGKPMIEALAQHRAYKDIKTK